MLRRNYYQHCDYRSGFFVYHEIPNSFNSNNSFFVRWLWQKHALVSLFIILILIFENFPFELTIYLFIQRLWILLHGEEEIWYDITWYIMYIVFHHQRLWILLYGEEERCNSAVTEKVGTSLKTIHLISQSVDFQLFTKNLSFEFFFFQNQKIIFTCLSCIYLSDNIIHDMCQLKIKFL